MYFNCFFSNWTKAGDIGLSFAFLSLAIFGLGLNAAYQAITYRLLVGTGEKATSCFLLLYTLHRVHSRHFVRMKTDCYK